MEAVRAFAGCRSQGEEDSLLPLVGSGATADGVVEGQGGIEEIKEDECETEEAILNGHVESPPKYIWKDSRNERPKFRVDSEQGGDVPEVEHVAVPGVEERWRTSEPEGEECSKKCRGPRMLADVIVPCAPVAGVPGRYAETDGVCAGVQGGVAAGEEQDLKHAETLPRGEGASGTGHSARPLHVGAQTPPAASTALAARAVSHSLFSHILSSAEDVGESAPPDHSSSCPADCSGRRQRQASTPETRAVSSPLRVSSLPGEGEELFLASDSVEDRADEKPKLSPDVGPRVSSSLSSASSVIPSPALSPSSASAACGLQQDTGSQEAAQVVVDRLRKEKVEATQIFAETLSRYDEEIRSLKAQLAVATSQSSLSQRSSSDQKSRRFSSFSASRFAHASAFGGQPRVPKATSGDLFASSSPPPSAPSSTSQSRQQEHAEKGSGKETPNPSRVPACSGSLPLAGPDGARKNFAPSFSDLAGEPVAVGSSSSADRSSDMWMQDTSRSAQTLEPSADEIRARPTSPSSLDVAPLLSAPSAAPAQGGDAFSKTCDELQQVSPSHGASSGSPRQTESSACHLRVSSRVGRQDEGQPSARPSDHSDNGLSEWMTAEGSQRGIASTTATEAEKTPEEAGVTAQNALGHSCALEKSHSSSNVDEDRHRAQMENSHRDAEPPKQRGRSGSDVHSSSLSSKPSLQRVKSRIAATSMMARKLYGMGRLASGLHYYPGSTSSSSGAGEAGGGGVARLTDGQSEKDAVGSLKGREEGGSERAFVGCRNAPVIGTDETTFEGGASEVSQAAPAEVSMNKGASGTGPLTEADCGRETTFSPRKLVDDGACVDSAPSLHGEKKTSFPLSLLRLDGGSGRGVGAESTHDRALGETARRTPSPPTRNGPSAALEKGTEKQSSSSSLLQHSGSSTLQGATMAPLQSSSSSSGSGGGGGGGGGRSWKTLFSRERFGGAGTRGSRQQGVSSSAGCMSAQEENAAAAASVLSTATWIDVILPDWQRQQGSQRFKKLLGEGVPHEVRGEVWKKAVGDQLHITPRLYEMLLGRVQHVRSYLMRTSRRYRDRINETMRTEGDEEGGGEEHKDPFLPDIARGASSSFREEKKATWTDGRWPDSARGEEVVAGDARGSCCRCCIKKNSSRREAEGPGADGEPGTPSAPTGEDDDLPSDSLNEGVGNKASSGTDKPAGGHGQKCGEESSAGCDDREGARTCSPLAEATKSEHALAADCLGAAGSSASSMSVEDSRDCGSVSFFPCFEGSASSSSSAPRKDDPQAHQEASLSTRSPVVGDEVPELANALCPSGADGSCCCCCKACGCRARREARSNFPPGTGEGPQSCCASNLEIRITEGTEEIPGRLYTSTSLPCSHSSASALDAYSSNTPSYSSCACGFFNWENDVFAAFQTIGMDLHRTLPRLGACQTSKRLLRSNTGGGAPRSQPGLSNETGKAEGGNFSYATADTAEPTPWPTESVSGTSQHNVCSSDPSCEGTDSPGSPSNKPVCQRRNSVSGSSYVENKQTADSRSSASTRSSSSKHSKGRVASHSSASFTSGPGTPPSSFASARGRNGEPAGEGEEQANVVDSQAVQPLPFGVPASHMMCEYLRCVLEAYAMFRPDIGYVQGMAYIAATLLLYMDEYSTFVCLSNLLLRRSLQAFYTFDMTVVGLYFRTFDALLAERLPNVAGHFEALGIHSDIFLIEWMYTLFTRCLPFELVGRVWDLFLVEGDAILFQTSLAILAYFQDELQTGTLDDCMAVLSSSTTTHFQAMQTEKFLACFRNMPVTQQRVDSLMASLSAAMSKERQRQQHAALRKTPEGTKKGGCSPRPSAAPITSQLSLSVFPASSTKTSGCGAVSEAGSSTPSASSAAPTSTTEERKPSRPGEAIEEDRGASTSRGCHVGSLVAGSSVFGAFKGKKEDRGRARGGRGGSREGKKGDLVVRNSPATLW